MWNRGEIRLIFDIYKWNVYQMCIKLQQNFSFSKKKKRIRRMIVLI